MADSDQVAYETKMRLLSEEIARAQALHDAVPEQWRTWWESGASELRCILMTCWDPLGVLDFGAWDEYDAYLASLGNLIRDFDDEDRATSDIAAFLAHVQLDFMGLREADPERNRTVAATIVGWYGWSLARGRVSPGTGPGARRPQRAD